MRALPSFDFEKSLNYFPPLLFSFFPLSIFPFGECVSGTPSLFPIAASLFFLLGKVPFMW